MGTYLSRTPASAVAAERRKFTYSCWFKKTQNGTTNYLLGGNIGGSSYTYLRFDTDDSIRFRLYDGGNQADIQSNDVFRDPASWYHVVLQFDSTQSTNTNRVKIYVNNRQITSLQANTYPSQDYSSWINHNSEQRINSATDGYAYFADVHQTGNQIYAPSSFGETDSTTGEWKPKNVSGLSYGTNGFHLKFENSGAMGTDSSGNNNTFTVNNAGTNPQVTDTPSNNFATWNHLVSRSFQYPFSLQNAGLKVTSDSNSSYGSTAAATISLGKGKWYWEFKYTTTTGAGGVVVGWGEDTFNFNYQADAYPYKTSLGSTSGVFYRADGGKVVNGTETGSAGGAWAQNDIIGVAVDLDNGNITFYKNGTSQFTETSVFTSTISYYPEFYGYSSKGGQANFGNPPFTIASGNADANGHGNFEYSVPSGHYAICTKNINAYG